MILLTLIAALNVVEGAQAAAIGAGGFGVLLIALCFYVLADIRAIIQRGSDIVKEQRQGSFTIR